MSATELKKVFLKMGEVAFGHHPETSNQVESTMETRSASLQAILQKIFGDKRPSDCLTKLIIPARNMQLGKTVFFGTLPHDRAFDEELFSPDGLPENELLWKTVHRSTALPPHYAPAGEYLDGGVSPFANPSYAAYLGVKPWFDWDAEKVDLFFHSVGTGYHLSHVDHLPSVDNEGLYGLMVHASPSDRTRLN